MFCSPLPGRSEGWGALGAEDKDPPPGYSGRKLSFFNKMQNLIRSKLFILLGLVRRILIPKGLLEYSTKLFGSGAFIRSLEARFRPAAVEKDSMNRLCARVG